MALASQTTRQDQIRRTSGGAGWSSRRRRKRSRQMSAFVLLVILVGVVGWWGWTTFLGPESTLAANADAAATTDPLPDPGDPAQSATAGAPAIPAARTQPTRNDSTTVLRMGESAAPMAGSNTPVTQTPPQTRSPIQASNQSPAQPPLQNPRSTPPAEQPSRSTQSTLLDGVARLIADGESLRDRNQPVQARALLNRALHDDRATPAQRERARSLLGQINEVLVFSNTIIDGDPIVERYVVKSGDTLSKIAAQQRLFVDWRFIQRTNGIADPSKIRVGQTLKLVRGPFHAVVDKSDFRMDLYASDGADSTGRIFIRSYAVGLGEHGATPTGSWVVRQDSKLVNPSWTNPRTGEYFNADDPQNPIGERWVGLDGADPQTSLLSGYGLHGTIDPTSIGREMSMGCVRLLPGEIDIVYETMSEGVSTVTIVP